MRTLTRRQALLAMAGGGAALLLGAAAPQPVRRNRLGIVIYALGIHQRANWAGRHTGLAPALAFLEECHRLGAGGIQCPISAQDAPRARELARRADKYEMHVEAILDPPRDSADLPRFEHDIRVAKKAGANLARTVILPGRRYEQFKTLAEFHTFEARGLAALQRAEPVLARHRFRLAVENHKDQLVAEKLATLRRLDSEWIGLCLDVANNFALMEDPLESARAFAPLTYTVHLKDMVVKDYADGWLLTDVALGEGFLDLKAFVRIVRQAKPNVRFNLETITRDAIRLPVRTEAFWATVPGPRQAALDRASALVNTRPGVAFPPDPSTLSAAQQLDLERRQIERSLIYAREHLGL
jgi:sugar phosphate isomerase/epimerase